MKIKKFLILAIFSALMVVPSCKKDDKDEVNYKNSFKGSIDFSLPEFVAPGDVYTLTPSGLTRPEEGKGIGYYWDCEKMKIHKDTVRTENDPLTDKGSLQFTVRDTLGMFQMKCVAFAEGYYSASKGKDFIIIHPTQSLVYEDFVEGKMTMTDERDGRKYDYKKIGNRYWMIQNLSYAEKGMSFLECKAVDAVYGRYYNWEEAKTVCPEGWRLPDEKDWNNLFESLAKDKNNSLKGIAGSMIGQAYLNNEKLWEFWPDVKITNASGFSALPIGYVQFQGNTPRFSGNLEYATFWSADELEDNSEQAVYHYIYMENPDVMTASAYKTSLGAAVRCVRD